MPNRWSNRWTLSLPHHNSNPQNHGNLSASFPTSPDEDSSEGEKYPGSAFGMISKPSKNPNPSSTRPRPQAVRRSSIKEVAAQLFTRRPSASGGNVMQVQVGNNNNKIVGVDVRVGTNADGDLPPRPPRKDTDASRDRARVRQPQAQPLTTRARGPSISSITKGISETITRSVSVSSPTRSSRRREGPVVVSPPAAARSVSCTLDKGEKSHDRHDSSYSSVSSSFELKRNGSKGSRLSRVIIPPPSPTLNTSQLLDLRAFLSDVETSLIDQDEFCQSFSHNLLFLIAIKETSIRENRRLNAEWKRGLTRELSVCREELGRVFTRKAVVGERSMVVVRELLAKLDEGDKKDGDMMSRKRGSFLEGFRGRSGSRSRPPLTHQSPTSPPQQNPNEITMEVVNKALSNLRKDLGLQKLLDDCILDAITRKCWKQRWCRNQSMRIEMRRFVGFVSGRCEKLAREEAAYKTYLERMEEVVDGGRRNKRLSGLSGRGIRNSWAS